MSEEDKDNFDNKVEEDKVEEKQLEGDNAPKSDEKNETQETSQPESDIGHEEDVKPTVFDQENSENINNNDQKIDEAKESNFDQDKDLEKLVEEKKHEVIHKKDGRLHIYVRQDKYKGELKSKNWVGRLYFEGKQKIFSSGTTNLEEAIPILEKWFDDIHANKESERQIAETVTTQETVANKETTQTIETNVKPKPTCVYTSGKPMRHKMIHTLLLCHQQFWNELKYIKWDQQKIKAIKLSNHAFWIKLNSVLTNDLTRKVTA